MNARSSSRYCIRAHREESSGAKNSGLRAPRGRPAARGVGAGFALTLGSCPPHDGLAAGKPWITLLRAIVLCLLVPLCADVAALEVEARLTNDSISLGDRVRLVLETDAQVDAEPDLAPLEQDFWIAGRGKRSSVSVVNGRRVERHQLVLTLVPRRAGLIEIPPIRLGTVDTQPLQLRVAEPSVEDPAQSISRHPEPAITPFRAPPVAASPPSPDPGSAASSVDDAILMEASIAPARVRVGQQAVLIARVLLASPVTGPGLGDPLVEGARLFPLGEDWDQVRRGGRNYHVYERRYALFPEVTGLLTLPPLVFEGWAQDPADGTQAGHLTPVRSSSESLSLDVLAAEQSPPGANWLPARDIRLDEAGPETYQVRVGQPLERAISVTADGIAAADLPELVPSTPHDLEEHRSTAVLWDERLPTGVVGTRREAIRLTAQEPGRFQLPALSLDWWDTDTGQWKTSRLPARELIVLPATPDAAATARLFDPGTSRDTWTGTAGPDALETRRAPAEKPLAEDRREVGESRLWTWTTVALGAIWLLTIAVLWGRRRRAPASARRGRPQGEERRASDYTTLEPTDPVTAAVGDVRRAYESGDAGAAREALLAWAALVLPQAPPGNLALLAKRCREPLRGEILLLEQAFFSPRPIPWDRRRVWERLGRFEPLPVQEPATFRRKKPLRRRRSTPEVTE